MLKPKPDERSVMAYVSEYVYYFNILQRDPSQLTDEERLLLEKIKNAQEESIDDLSEEFSMEDVSAFNWEDLKMEGYLRKLDAGFPWLWRKKWCSLQGSRLVYYKEMPNPSKQPGNAEDNVPQGYVPLLFVKSVEENKMRRNSFMVISSDRVEHFEAGSKELMQWWIGGLNKATALFKKKNTPKTKPNAPTSDDQNASLIGKTVGDEKQYKEGYLLQLNLLKQWKTKFLVLKDGVLYVMNNKGEKRETRISLYGCKLEEYVPLDQPNTVENSCFKITTPPYALNMMTDTYVFKGETWEETIDWLNTILRQQAIIEDFIKSISITN